MREFTCCSVGLLLLALSGCSSPGGSAALGVLGGAAVGAGGYEYNLKTQKDRIDQDLKDGKIDQKEYDIRKDQIERDSLIQ
ncbi:MAG: gas vesicle protein GvpG [Nitrospirales bacterium]|nr:hypothetical protein [Nitrospira sp.]MDR4500052.1 gas vesicle protein GvpG [Nitrospirales bacterium]